MTVIGVGRMGLPICARLVRAGFRVNASDIRPEAAGDVRAVGADWVQSAAEAATGAELVITILPGTRELSSAAAVIVPRLARGATWIDMTSASPQTAAEWVERAQVRGVECVDAPMGGGPESAAQGTLQMFVGGPRGTLERHRAIFDALGTVEHMGANGAGYVTKLLVNLLWFGQAVATGEALLLARRSGLDIETVRQTLTRSAPASAFIRDVVPALLEGDYLESYGLDRCHDQLDAIVGLAQEHGVPFEVAGAVRSVFASALDRFGAVDGELLPIAWLEEQAGIRLRVEP